MYATHYRYTGITRCYWSRYATGFIIGRHAGFVIFAAMPIINYYAIIVKGYCLPPYGYRCLLLLLAICC